ncbi:exosortase E/protease, VPEID-CTERM system [Roseovarius sp.]|uniref:exosortase E/protease, VPEID-CTERM system n=1 Tax=Roseovarius sp. TaxID=1486281 RepID=UPI003A96F42C
MDTGTDTLSQPRRVMNLGVLFVAELVLLVVGYQVLSDLECHSTGIEDACRGLRLLALWLLCASSLLVIYLWARPEARVAFTQSALRAPGGYGWAMLHGGGVVGMLGPLILISPEDLNARFEGIFPLIGLGAIIAALGGLLWLMTIRAWLTWLKGRGASLLAISAFAAALPGVVVLAGPFWTVQAVTDGTFVAVFLMLRLFSPEVIVDPAAYVIGTPEFQVMVADSCSGIEGLVLITAFLALYGVLFRDELRLRRFGLVIWPLALVISWLFNAVRITGLILIGVHVSPELAVNGFHSFAGWLMFTLVSIGILVVVGRSGFALQAGSVPRPRSTPPLTQDDVAGRILPFIVFALSGLIAQAFWSEPALAYPLQVVMMLAALWLVRDTLVRYLVWPSILSVLVGLGVGGVWVLTASPSGPASEAISGLGRGAFALWAALRILGTVALVPVIEELFFRGYIQARLDWGTLSSRITAVAVSACLFALVHGRWIEAGLAGVVFSMLYMRNGRLADAITAHAVANAFIAAVALWRGDWALI